MCASLQSHRSVSNPHVTALLNPWTRMHTSYRPIAISYNRFLIESPVETKIARRGTDSALWLDPSDLRHGTPKALQHIGPCLPRASARNWVVWAVWRDGSSIGYTLCERAEWIGGGLLHKKPATE